MDLSTFRHNLKTKLKQQKLSLNSLAELSDLSEDTLRSVIYGDSRDIKLSTLIKIADVLKSSIDELIDRKYYSHEEYKLFSEIHTLPKSSLDVIHTIVKLERHCLLTKSKSGKYTVPLLIPTGNIKDGMYYNGSTYDTLDISEYPRDLRDSISFALKITTNNFSPIYSVNDILLVTTKHRPEYYDIIIYINKSGKLFIRKYTELSLESINGFGNIILTKDISNYTPLGVILKVVREFDIEQYR